LNIVKDWQYGLQAGISTGNRAAQNTASCENAFCSRLFV